MQRPNFSNSTENSSDSHIIVLNNHTADQRIRLRQFLTVLRNDSSLAANIMVHASPTGGPLGLEVLAHRLIQLFTPGALLNDFN